MKKRVFIRNCKLDKTQNVHWIAPYKADIFIWISIPRLWSLNDVQAEYIFQEKNVSKIYFLITGESGTETCWTVHRFPSTKSTLIVCDISENGEGAIQDLILIRLDQI